MRVNRKEWRLNCLTNEAFRITEAKQCVEQEQRNEPVGLSFVVVRLYCMLILAYVSRKYQQCECTGKHSTDVHAVYDCD